MRRLLAWSIVAALVTAACSTRRDPPRPVEVLLIGLDGASWTFVDPLLARGALPTLDRLIRNGVRAPLKTLSPSLSPAVWTTIATGKRPARHGIEDFYWKDKDGKNPRLVSTTLRRTEALWTIVSGAGRSAGFVGWWVTWPAERVSGYVVSDQFLRPSHEKLEDGTYPQSLARELDAKIPSDWPWLREVLASGALKLLSDRAPGPAQTEAARFKQALFFYGQDHRGEQSALHLLAGRARPSLFGIVSRKLDSATHNMWSFLPPESRGASEYSRILEPFYRYEDDLVRRLVEAAGPAVNVLIVSDHGFEPFEGGWDHKQGAPDGIFVASGPAFRRGVSLSEVSVVDITPTVLHILGMKVARDMEGLIAADALADARPVGWVASYETGRRHAPGARSPLEEEIREELRALGYVR